MQYASSSFRGEIRERLRHVREVLADLLPLDAERQDRVIHNFEEAHRKFGEVLARYEEPYRLIVVGGFNAGKSSLINALLGIPLLKEGIVPTTGAITEIWYGTEPCGEVYDSSGQLIASGSINEASRYADQNTPEGQMVVGRGVRVVLRLPNLLLRSLIIIDSPGLGADEMDTRTTLEALHVADAALLAVSALRPDEDTTLTAADILATTGVKLQVVLTWADEVSESEFEHALASVHQHFSAISAESPIKFASPRVREALMRWEAALQAGDETNAQAAKADLNDWGYEQLHSHITGRLSLGGSAANSRADQTLTLASKILFELLSGASKELAGLEAQAGTVKERLSEIDQYLNDVVRPKIHQLDGQIEDLVRTHVGEYVNELGDALELYIDQLAETNIIGAVQQLWTKAIDSRRLERELQLNFKKLFPDDQLDITADNIDRAVRRLLELEWRRIVGDLKTASSGEQFDASSVASKLSDHLAEVALSVIKDLGVAILLLLVPGGEIVEIIVGLLGLFGTQQTMDKQSQRTLLAKRQARLQVRGYRRTLAHKLASRYQLTNQTTYEAIETQFRQSRGEHECHQARVLELTQRWKSAVKTLEDVLAIASESPAQAGAGAR